MNEPASPHSKSSRRFRWILSGIILFIVTGTSLFLVSRDPFANDPRFVITKSSESRRSLSEASSVSDLTIRCLMRIQETFSKRAHPYTFGGGSTNFCSIHGLLNQCDEVTGRRYVIFKDVASGIVRFGHDQPLNGEQWVAAFTHALQTGKPGWNDSKSGKWREENLVVLTNDAKTVLVIPPEMAKEFQSKKRE